MCLFSRLPAGMQRCHTFIKESMRSMDKLVKNRILAPNVHESTMRITINRRSLQGCLHHMGTQSPTIKETHHG
jgi:hypothetical protein